MEAGADCCVCCLTITLNSCPEECPWGVVQPSGCVGCSLHMGFGLTAMPLIAAPLQWAFTVERGVWDVTSPGQCGVKETIEAVSFSLKGADSSQTARGEVF